MQIKILSETTVNPITKIGERAGICWGANITDPEKNYKRGLQCLKDNHGRALEFVDVELFIDEVSARFGREWYTHIGGSPTRLQKSTRYNLEENKPFSYVTPGSILNNPQARDVYINTMQTIWDNIVLLKEFGIPNEDATMLLPLGMTTGIVDKRNVRNFIDMSHVRMCNRAFWEFRDVMDEICKLLSELSEEWVYIIENYFKPNCKFFVCKESRKCTGDHRLTSKVGYTINKKG